MFSITSLLDSGASEALRAGWEQYEGGVGEAVAGAGRAADQAVRGGLARLGQTLEKADREIQKDIARLSVKRLQAKVWLSSYNRISKQTKLN